jgi:hypothetical protein
VGGAQYVQKLPTVGNHGQVPWRYISKDHIRHHTCAFLTFVSVMIYYFRAQNACTLFRRMVPMQFAVHHTPAVFSSCLIMFY